MPRQARVSVADVVCHVINRENAVQKYSTQRLPTFRTAPARSLSSHGNAHSRILRHAGSLASFEMTWEIKN